MTIAETMLGEFDHEMATTRTVLERVPDADPAWKPHPKSYSIGDLALHLANIPTCSPFPVRTFTGAADLVTT